MRLVGCSGLWNKNHVKTKKSISVVNKASCALSLILWNGVLSDFVVVLRHGETGIDFEM